MRYTQLPAHIWAANRAKLVAQLAPQSLAVLHSNDILPSNADGTLGFVQNADLFYLSGIDQEETVLILFPDARDPKRRELLFVRETNEYLAAWEGNKLTKDEATRVSGIENVFWLSEMDKITRELMFEAQTVYLNANEHLRAELTTQTRQDRLNEELRRRFPLHNYARLAPLLYRQRMIKSPEEIEAIREATRTTAAGFERLLKWVHPGVAEFEVEAELAHEYLRRRSRAFSYPPIIAAGKNACVLHYVENNAVCEDGEMLLMDVAAEYGSYRSDMTRTIPVNGRFTPRQRAVYDAVLRVLRYCNSQLRPGVLLKNYQKDAEKFMENELVGLGLIQESERAQEEEEKPAFKKYFMHGVSHHIGLDVHDVFDGNVPLAENMVLTIEPGIYIRDEALAVRLENIVVIGRDANEDLMSRVPIEADEIEAAMARE